MFFRKPHFLEQSFHVTSHWGPLPSPWCLWSLFGFLWWIPPPPSPGHNPGLSALDYELSDQSLVSWVGEAPLQSCSHPWGYSLCTSGWATALCFQATRLLHSSTTFSFFGSDGSACWKCVSLEIMITWVGQQVLNEEAKKLCKPNEKERSL